jgi:undecaprenyl-diphosphatase
MNISIKGKRWGNLAFLLSMGLFFAGMIICFIFADGPAFSRLRQNPLDLHSNGWIQAFEQLGKVYPVVWLLLFWGWITGRHKTVLVSILALIITIPAVWCIKAAVQRPRPSDVIKAEANIENNSKLPRRWSFPSGDTASVFAAGTVLASSAWWPWTIGIAICCGGVGALRVVELAHYPSDVFAGAALGILCGWAATRIKDKHPQIENILGGMERLLSIIGILLIPILIWIFQGPDKLKILLKFYVPVALVISVAGWLWKSQRN